jgi:hypothetical protein
MARSRNIKPGFFQNEVLADMPALVRLLFAGLWTIADRDGRLEDRARRIKVALMPYDEIDVDGALDMLSAGSDPFIIRYEVDGARYIQITKWHEHQKPHHMELASQIPAFSVNESSTTCAQTVHEECTPRPPVKGISNKVKGISNQESEESAIEPEAVGPVDDFIVQRDRFTDCWNNAQGVRLISSMSNTRLSQLRARLGETIRIQAVAWNWLDALEEMIRTKFPLPVTRGDPSGWKPDVDWILKPDSLPAIVEGKYDWEKKTNGRRDDFTSSQRHDPATAKGRSGRVFDF